MTAPLTADDLDLLRTVNQEFVTYVHGAFFISGIETDAFTAHRLRNLILAELLAQYGPVVELTDAGREALA
ncbi:hypothetical protein [Paractinoplanes toevensis]|uniref:Uncharacterized protein n=1 Tax=Paractinoplanes toevensis TaxID=571911 RepID=A0A919T4Q4_9ACTN|nr:hypothetical protein [Actinoplanes toevensis]GIM88828.1 hypothetical protein Ato02nite_006210 [Actinoplanes toevensis]